MARGLSGRAACVTARHSRSVLMGTAMAAVAILAAACTTPGDSVQPGPAVASSPSATTPASASALPSGPVSELGGSPATPTAVPATPTPVPAATRPSPAGGPVTINVRMMPNINDTPDSCPTYQPPWKLWGRISATKQVSVTYQWQRSDGTNSAPQTITVGQGTGTEVTDTVPPPGPSGYPFTDTLHVTSPFSVSSFVRVSFYCVYFEFGITQTTLPGGINGVPYSFTVTGTGGDGVYSWSATGLPPGLSMDSSTGVISGVPRVTFPAGVNDVSYSVTVALYYPAKTSQPVLTAIGMNMQIYR